MAKRKAGDFVESMFDLGLGALGAAAHGFGEMTKLRKERKEAQNADRDIVDDITKGVQASVDRFKAVVDRAATELLPHDAPEQNKEAEQKKHGIKLGDLKGHAIKLATVKPAVRLRGGRPPHKAKDKADSNRPT